LGKTERRVLECMREKKLYVARLEPLLADLTTQNIIAADDFKSVWIAFCVDDGGPRGAGASPATMASVLRALRSLERKGLVACWLAPRIVVHMADNPFGKPHSFDYVAGRRTVLYALTEPEVKS
jgi:hypothetical protein